MEGFIYMILKHHGKYVRLGFYYFYIILNATGQSILYLEKSLIIMIMYVPSLYTTVIILRKKTECGCFNKLFTKLYSNWIQEQNIYL